MKDQALLFNYSENQPERLDKFLVAHMPDYSRSRLQGLITDGFVKVSGEQVVKSGWMVKVGDTVELIVPPTQSTELVPENIPLQIIFENKDLMVVDKPAGMVVHPGAGHATGTLVHAALAHAPEMEGISGEQRPGVVHRLDKETSGLILLAKNDHAHHWLQDQFRLRKVVKIYLALVDGHPPTPTGRIEAPIGRDPSHRMQMGVVTLDKGRESETEYKTLESFDQYAFLEVHPLTGRTHQIRLHLAFIHCPIVGDMLYGHRHPTLDITRHFLHAARLTIQLPGESNARTFSAPLPPELEQVLNSLRNVH